ncbi:unnamed protein product [Discosporangium mesarthrocarpum]
MCVCVCVCVFIAKLSGPSAVLIVCGLINVGVVSSWIAFKYPVSSCIVPAPTVASVTVFQAVVLQRLLIPLLLLTAGQSPDSSSLWQCCRWLFVGISALYMQDSGRGG